MLYQQAINLHKILNDPTFPNSFENVTIIDQTIFTSRLNTYRVYRNNSLKIGMNMTANKFYCISELIGLNLLNLGYVHFKNLMKIQLLKYGKT